MPRAKNKIYYDIEESDYSVVVGRLTFYFSKIQYVDKFSEMLVENRNHISKRLSYQYGTKVECDEMCDMYLYSKIEKNNFRVYKDGERVWRNNLTFVGEIKTLKN